MKSICVYLGANAGTDPDFKEAVLALGHEIVKRNLKLVYGGSSLGLMGLLARTVKEGGGYVSGVIPQALLVKEQSMKNLDEMHVVDSMFERKRMMHDLADMFLVMPGGLGTLEEAFDTWNAIKIGLMSKPLGFLNVAHFFDSLFSFVNHCEQSGFVSNSQTKLAFINTDLGLLLNDLVR